MPKRVWTKLDVQKRLVVHRSLLAALERRLLADDFEEDRYRFLKEIVDSWNWHLREEIKDMRMLAKEKANG